VSTPLKKVHICILSALRHWVDNAGQFWDFTSTLVKRIFAHLRYRAGTLTFLRFRQSITITYWVLITVYSRSRNGELPEQVASLSVVDTWITHLAFSTWNLVQSGWCKISRERIGTILNLTKYRWRISGIWNFRWFYRVGQDISNLARGRLFLLCTRIYH
jgi:hypothetical protein